MPLTNVEAVYPLAPAQQGLLFHAIDDRSRTAYVGQYAWNIESLDVDTFVRAWRAVVARHAALRTCFVWESLAQPAQVVRAHVDLDVVQHDWSALAPDARTDRATQFARSERARGFDLTAAPLLRVAILRLGPARHRVVWTHHHIILDGWSIPIVVNDLVAYYAAYQRHVDPQLPAPPPYRRYIDWLRQQDAAQAERYWRQLLGGLRGPTTLRIDRAETSRWLREQSDRRDGVGEVSAEIPPAVMQDMRRCARALRVTFTAIIQAAWAIALSHYSGRDDVVYGTVMHGRPAALDGIEDMVGLLINTLPVRIDVRDDWRAEAFLQHVHAQYTELNEYQYTPLVTVQSYSPRPAGTPLFDHMLSVQNLPLRSEGEAGDGLKASDLAFHLDTHYALAVVVTMGERGMLRVQFDAGRFSRTDIERFARHIVHLAAQLIADPDRRIGDLTRVDAADPLLRRSWSGEPACAGDRTVMALFEEQVAQRGEALAVVSEDERVSYRDLATRVTRLAGALRRLGVGPEQIVALSVDRGVGLIVGMLGILNAGAAYLPLDPTLPDARRQALLDSSQAVAVVTERASISRLGDVSRPLVVIDAEEAPDGQADDWARRADAEGASASPGHLAYVMYTSGSTGQPKGVMIEHRSLANLAVAHARLFEIAPGSQVLQFAPCSFDASVSEIFMTLATGATLHVAGQAQPRAAIDVARLLRDRQISYVALPPSVLSVLDDDLPLLRTVVSAGEPCPAAIVDRWSRGRTFINAYGPTEATVCASLAISPPAGAPPSIGAPLPGARVYILDEKLRPAPLGAYGELCVGGVGVARGYSHQPGLTAERFVPDSYGEVPGARMYRTGDLAYLSATGEIEFIGRGDDQVKIRGFRVEPGEIAAVLKDHPRVSDAVVVARGAGGDDARLDGYVTTRDGEPVDLHELKRFLETRLPSYLIPSALRVLDRFPFTPSGKIDRRALPPADAMVRETPVAVREPRSETERVVQQLWRDVLQRDDVGLYENFFDLGGHSLRILQLQGRIKDAFHRDVAISALFAHPTVSAFAAYLSNGVTADASFAEGRRQGARQAAASRRAHLRARPRPSSPARSN